jgi:hypothetical protein
MTPSSASPIGGAPEPGSYADMLRQLNGPRASRRMPIYAFASIDYQHRLFDSYFPALVGVKRRDDLISAGAGIACRLAPRATPVWPTASPTMDRRRTSTAMKRMAESDRPSPPASDARRASAKPVDRREYIIIASHDCGIGSAVTSDQNAHRFPL